jgi:uncharacterized protein YbjT (DUF2867 family)
VSNRIVTVFGGTGFLGRRIVRHLADHGFAVRIASRHPQRARMQFGDHGTALDPVAADIHDDAALAAAVDGAYAVVNAVSLYVERDGETFRSVHIDGAARIAQHARRHGAARLAHVSGIGADAASPSDYIRSRGEGEAAVRRAFAEATIVRPSVMFAPDDAFLTTILALLRRLPAYPMFGRGSTRLQPVHVDDVAEAIARILARDDARDPAFECGGPRIYSYAELLRTVANHARLRPILLPVPFALWRALAGMAELLPSAPLTRNQVDLMRTDNVTAPGLPGLAELRIAPRSVEEVLAAMLQDS